MIKIILKEQMATTIEVLGFGIGILGFLAAIYSIITQRKFETKFKEKERLKILAKRLDGIIFSMDSFYEIEDPTHDVDLQYQLHLASQRIISEAFDKKKDIISIPIKTQLSIEEVTKNPEGKEIKKTNFIYVEKKEDIIKYLEKGVLTSFDIAFVRENDSYTISYFLFSIPNLFNRLEKLENEFGDLLEEFSPNLLKSLKDCIKDLLIVAFYSKDIEIDTKTFNKSDDMGLWVYNAIMKREEISPYLNKMMELKVKFETLRESLITTSYT